MGDRGTRRDRARSSGRARCGDQARSAGRLAGAVAAVALAAGPVAPASAQVADSARAYTYAEALARAGVANEGVLAEGAAVDRASAELWAARGRRLPEVTVTARSTRIDEALVLDLSPIRGALLGLHPSVPAEAVPPFEGRVQEETFHAATVTGTVPLFTGGRIRAGVRAADAAVAAARASERAARGAVAVEVTRRYFGLQLAREARATRERTRATLARHVERALLLEENGQIARAERLRAEVMLAEADRDLRESRVEEAVAARALASTLSVEGPVVPSTPFPAPVAETPVEVFTAAALAGHPGLARLAAERERARQGVRAARGAFAPTVGLFASRELYTEDLTQLEPEWAVGVAVTLPVFEGGRRLAAVSSARALEREVGLRESRARRDVRLLVERRHAELEAARAQAAALESTRSLAEESLRAQQQAFAAGLATSLDVLDAERALARVELGLLKARYDAAVAMAGLLEAAGLTDRLAEEITTGPEAGA